MNNPQLDIRIGTIVQVCDDLYSYIRQILPEGFESFQLSFPPMAVDVDLADSARRVAAELEGSAPLSARSSMAAIPWATGPTT